jgi:hypothetical protein
MNVRCIPILQLGRLSVRSFHLTTRRLAIMEGGVTGQELEEALKTRLSAVHSEIKDISGKTHPGSTKADNQGDVVSPMKLSS